ncbi:MAG: ABC transporter ATP-binding protein [Candidatus Rokubacteria bacterium]|nr:ABC transporter ATP-binding protein [Candidatus Rokubacteria bacterium]
MLTLQDVSMHFDGVIAVRDLNLAVPQGQITGLIGPNGAGKTTVFNLITGVNRPTSGSIRFREYELTCLAPHVITRLGIARTFQNIRLFSSMTVWEHIQVVLRPRRDLRAWEVSEQILDLFELTPHRDRRAVTLAFADQRRLEIARALATAPQLLLLDEPASGMSQSEAERLAEVLLKIHRQGVTLFLIEHDMSVVMNVCHHIVVLNFGEKIGEGSPGEMQKDPRVQEAYLGETQS